MNLDPIRLPRPEKDGGKSVLASLWARRTVREISAKRLPLQTLSNLLWAAGGVNRRRAAFDRSGRTAGSASSSQEIDLYVAMPEGAFLYEAPTHQLTPVAAGDFRALSSHNGSTSAPVHIFYVADVSRFWEGAGQPDPLLRQHCGIAQPPVASLGEWPTSAFVAALVDSRSDKVVIYSYAR